MTGEAHGPMRPSDHRGQSSRIRVALCRRAPRTPLTEGLGWRDPLDGPMSTGIDVLGAILRFFG